MNVGTQDVMIASVGKNRPVFLHKIVARAHAVVQSAGALLSEHGKGAQHQRDNTFQVVSIYKIMNLAEKTPPIILKYQDIQ